MTIPHHTHGGFRSQGVSERPPVALSRVSLWERGERTNSKDPDFELEYQKWRENDGVLLGWTSSAADFAFNLLPSLDSGITTACAGAARGVAYGAELPDLPEKVIMGANLAVLGAAVASLPLTSLLLALTLNSTETFTKKLLPSAIARVLQGFKKWDSLPETVREEVYSSTEKAVDQVFPDRSPQPWEQRAIRGLTGEALGAATGAVVGLRYGLDNSQGLGLKVVDSVQRQLYKNMHQRPSWQRALAQSFASE